MEKDIVEGPIGTVGKYDVEFKGGKLVAKIDAKPSEGVQAGIFVEVEASVVLDALKKAIPGTVDDVVFDLIKAALSQ